MNNSKGGRSRQRRGRRRRVKKNTWGQNCKSTVPKSLEEERRLQEKYGNMDLEERAFNILVDLGMVDLHSDPEDVTLGLEDDE